MGARAVSPSCRTPQDPTTPFGQQCPAAGAAPAWAASPISSPETRWDRGVPLLR